MDNEWGVDDETARLMRANLEAASDGSNGYVEENPDAPWWWQAIEMTMTIVVGADIPVVARLLGLDLGVMEPRMLVEAPWEDDASPLALIDLPGAVAIAEPNGWTTVQPDAVRALSGLGRIVSLYWNVNHVARFVVAEGGQILRDFDPVIDAGAGTGVPLPEETGVDWESEPIEQAAALQARVTGVQMTRRQVFGTPHPTATVPWPL